MKQLGQTAGSLVYLSTYQGNPFWAQHFFYEPLDLLPLDLDFG